MQTIRDLRATPRDRRRWAGRLAFLIAALVAGRARADAEPTLDAALLRATPRVLGYLREHGYRNVGVLKFRVKKGAAPASDHVGTLNLNLAERRQSSPRVARAARTLPPGGHATMFVARRVVPERRPTVIRPDGRGGGPDRLRVRGGATSLRSASGRRRGHPHAGGICPWN